VVKKKYRYTSTPPMGLAACTEPQCLYKGALYLFFMRWLSWAWHDLAQSECRRDQRVVAHAQYAVTVYFLSHRHHLWLVFSPSTTD